jgi:hypothetical protein
VITAEKLAARAHRRLELLVRQVAGEPLLKDCRTPRCVSCDQCRELAPLTRVPWAVLHARARGRPSTHATDDGRLVRDPDVELLECEVTEARDRAFIRERDRQLLALVVARAQWEREEEARADRELVAAVAARRAARTAEARRLAAERRRKREIAA